MIEIPLPSSSHLFSHWCGRFPAAHRCQHSHWTHTRVSLLLWLKGPVCPDQQKNEMKKGKGSLDGPSWGVLRQCQVFFLNRQLRSPVSSRLHSQSCVVIFTVGTSHGQNIDYCDQNMFGKTWNKKGSYSTCENAIMVYDVAWRCKFHKRLEASAPIKNYPAERIKAPTTYSQSKRYEQRIIHVI